MNPDFQIQPAEASDLEAIFELFSDIQMLHHSRFPELFKKPKNDSYFKKFFSGLIENPSEFLELLKTDQRVIGYIHFSFYDHDETIFTLPRKSVFIHQLIISPEYRRNEWAMRLIEHVKKEAKRLNATQINIDYWSFNSAAKSCFKKAGFSINREFMSLAP